MSPKLGAFYNNLLKIHPIYVALIIKFYIYFYLIFSGLLL